MTFGEENFPSSSLFSKMNSVFFQSGERKSCGFILFDKVYCIFSNEAILLFGERKSFFEAGPTILHHMNIF